ncbi:hypothetical protein BJY04DRAFT_195383 [Aspergillus karnatakaensis]|uniref:uncharacterized protein n=1 Tax=Aspergillus karnatakaensis TaxID=1810916 RepID=UPI003CCCDE67
MKKPSSNIETATLANWSGCTSDIAPYSGRSSIIKVKSNRNQNLDHGGRMTSTVGRDSTTSTRREPPAASEEGFGTSEIGCFRDGISARIRTGLLTSFCSINKIISGCFAENGGHSEARRLELRRISIKLQRLNETPPVQSMSRSCSCTAAAHHHLSNRYLRLTERLGPMHCHG